DPEVVAPAVGTVARVVLGLRRRADHVAGPVVEAADPGQEAERNRRQLDGRDHLAVPDRMPALRPADEEGDAQPDPEEEGGHPRDAQPAGREQSAPTTRWRLGAGVKLVVRDGRRGPFFPAVRNWTSASSCCLGSDLNVSGMMFGW